MVSYGEPLVVNHGESCWAERLWTMVSYAELVVVNPGMFFWTSSCMLYWADWLWIVWVMLNQWLWIMASHAEPVVVNHVVLCCTSCCESWCVMLIQWLWIMLCYAERNGCESLCVMLSQLLCIMAGHAEPMVVNQGVLCCVSGWESWCVNLCKWLGIICVIQVKINYYNYISLMPGQMSKWVIVV
jgi:hypothetical protein